jgi:LysM repeat protein
MIRSAMERWKRMFYYLLINVAVSACVVLTILYFWERANNSDTEPEPGEVVLLVSPTNTLAVLVDDETPQPTAPSFVYETYVIESGDTLSEIATLFGVTVDEIMSFNSIDNADSLAVGDILVIPVIATPTPLPPPTEPAATRTPVPTPEVSLEISETPAEGDVILEIVSVAGVGDIFEERVLIRQTGEGSVSLANWQLAGSNGQLYSFPQITLFKDGAVTVYTGSGNNTVVELYMGLAQSIWQVGDVVSLLDPDGNVVAAFQIP